MKELRKHPYHYLVLCLLLSVSVSGFVAFWPDHAVQRIFAVTFGFSYWIWGIVHHLSIHSFHRKHVLEYFFVSLFATAVLFLLAQ